jgi:hypothetical protein
MLPMAAIAALVVPGGVFRILGIVVAVVFLALLVVRVSSRGERAVAWAELPERVVRESGYRGRRREI